MQPIRSIITHLAVAIIGGGVALGGYLLTHRESGEMTDPSATSTTTASIPIDLPAPAVKELKKTSSAFVAIAKAVQPAVVNINTVQVIKQQSRGTPFGNPFENPFGDSFDNDFFRRFFGMPNLPQQDDQEMRRQGLGSGMIVDAEKGYILTNNHVVEGADEIKIMLADGRDFDVEVVGTDPHTDVGVLKIKNPPKDLLAVSLGDSDVVEVGDWAIAVGNPFGLSQTVTVGIISAKGRANVNVVDFEDFIQTDAAINPGNSGGPLLNVDGSVIGVNTAIFSRSGGYQGIGFSIPSNMAKTVMNKLISGEKIERGYLGVYLQDLTSELAKNFKIEGMEGALVSQVIDDSPAEASGLKTGDVIVEFDGKPVKNVHELRNRVAFSPVGKSVPVVIIRTAQRQTLEVTLGQRPDEQATKTEPESAERLGIAAVTITPELVEKYQLKVNAGVVIVELDRSGLGARLGLREGDVMVELNRQTITNVEEFKKAASGLKEDEGILALVDRQGSRLFLAIQP
ncbi:MAG: DegQ family serine endoprotease [Deltaproteobacteria bacterium]|nr:DegQ family serine endoprotease [Deltaproteobacteria bacterium]